MADDRRSNPFVANAPPRDNINKIYRAGKRTALVSFGIDLATSEAETRMRSSILDSALRVSDIARHIELNIESAWISLTMRLGPDVNQRDPALKSGFLFGGYIPTSTSFIGGVLFRIDGHDPPTLETEFGKFFVLGGEEQSAEQLFKDIASRNLATVTSEGTGVVNNNVRAFLDAGAATIGRVSSRTASVGTRLRYAVLRSGYPYHEEWFDECATA